MNNKHKKWIALSLTLLASQIPFFANAAAANAEHVGEGTFYGYAGGGNCSFPYRDDLLTAAMNKTDYDNSAACGAVIVVTSEATGRSVTVRIDDQCPECKPGDVDLDQDAFALISPLEAGRIKIKWHYLANDDAGNLKLHFKEGSSQWWAGVQIRDHRYTIDSLEYRPSGSGDAYRSLPRYPYNYFIAQSGMGPGPYDFRIRDSKGQTLVVESIALALDAEIDLGVQFPLADGNTTPDVDNSDGSGTGSDASPGTPDTGTPDTGATDIGGGEAISLKLETSSDWNSGYCMQAHVTNVANSSLNWQVKFTAKGRIAYMWNAEWQQQGDQVVAEGVGWNKALNAGDTTEFGFCASR